jgi:hypothetical protein
VPAELRRSAFATPKPADVPVYTAVSLANGDAAILCVSAVRVEPDANPAQADVARRQFAQQFASSEAEGYALAARAAAKVVVNPKAID